MSVGAVGAVGAASPASPAQSSATAQKPAAAGSSAGASLPNSQQAAGSPNLCDPNQNMSTSDFVSLTEQVGKSANEPKDIMDMMKMVIALQILQKTLEATSEIIDSFINGE
tara:strand:- start:2916 stop:3248 length:333 start_codon:yes stop_codon:yes gene_type:complete